VLKRVRRQESCAPVRGLALWCQYIHTAYGSMLRPRCTHLAWLASSFCKTSQTLRSRVLRGRRVPLCITVLACPVTCSPSVCLWESNRRQRETLSEDVRGKDWAACVEAQTASI